MALLRLTADEMQKAKIGEYVKCKVEEVENA